MSISTTLILRRSKLVGRDGLFTITIKDGKIVSITPASTDVTNDGEEAGAKHDLGGNVWVGPGLKDNHTHFSTWALTVSRHDLSEARSAQEVIDAVARLNQELEDAGDSTSAIIGRDFRVGTWPDLDKEVKDTLDAVAPTRPVHLINGDLHSMWCNTAALKRVGMDPSKTSGLLKEHDCWAAVDIINNVPTEQLDDLVTAVAKSAASLGVTAIVDFEMTHNLRVWPRRVENGFRYLRVECAMYQEHIQDAVGQGLKSGDLVPGGKDLLTVGSYKIITDGSLGAQTAYCHEPYPGTTDNYGQWNYPTPTLKEMATYGTAHKLRLAIHAIGDRSNNLTLQTFASLDPPPLIGSSIEHAQLVDVEDFPHFKAMGLVASIQPQHLNDDKELADRFWCGRTDRAFAFRSLEDAGANLRLGSDAPVASLDPWDAMASAMGRERKGEEGTTGAAWHPEQALSSNKVAWEGSTFNGKTTVEVGDVADICLLKSDPLILSPKELRAMKVVGTLLGGDWTYQNL